MKQRDNAKMIPEQREGKPIDTESSVVLDNTEAAKALFSRARDRLLDVNRWHDTAGGWSAVFRLTDPDGREADRLVREGDHFRIDIPGPGPAGGDGYDWVRVEAAAENSGSDFDSIGLRVRPASPPVNDTPEAAHFYAPASTSSFLVTREGRTVSAGVYDRNTRPNDEASSVIDYVRDKIVGTGGVSGFSKLQWQQLVKGLLKQD